MIFDLKSQILINIFDISNISKIFEMSKMLIKIRDFESTKYMFIKNSCFNTSNIWSILTKYEGVTPNTPKVRLIFHIFADVKKQWFEVHYKKTLILNISFFKYYPFRFSEKYFIIFLFWFQSAMNQSWKSVWYTYCR